MKILNFKLFEALKQPKVDGYLLRRLEKAKGVGVVKDYVFDFGSNPKLTITFFNDDEWVKELKLHDFITRDFSKGNVVYKKVSKYTFKEAYNNRGRSDSQDTYTVDAQAAKEWWESFSKIEKDYIKENRTKTVICNGKEYSLNDFYNEQLPKLEIYQTILNFGFSDITTDSEKKNGTISIAKLDKDGLTIGNSHKITKNGKVYRMSSHSLTIKSFPPLTDLKDYEKALQFLYDNVFKTIIDKEIKEWKEKIDKNPNKIIRYAEDMPMYISKIFLSPKIHNLKKTGLFNNN